MDYSIWTVNCLNPGMTATTQATDPGYIPTAVVSDRDRLILEHLSQVKLIARRISDRLPGLVSLEDLVSAGTVGLISAIDRFDESQGVKLKTYAEFKIKGAILDSLRSLDWAPRSQRRRARALQSATAEVEQRLNSRAPVEEVALELGISVAECQDWMRDTRSLSFESLDASTVDDEGVMLGRQVAAGAEVLPSRFIEEQELRDMLAEAIRHMPRQERLVLSLVFHEELSLREISRIMGLHESRISQIKVRALERMRELMENQWPKKGARTSTFANCLHNMGTQGGTN